MVEAVIGIEFAPIPELTTVELVRLHERWSNDYPRTLEQPPLGPPVLPWSSSMPGFNVSFGGPLNIRLWSLASDERRLIQAQNDRLTLNWRRLGGGTYPSFDDLVPEFMKRWDDASSHLRELGVTPQLLAGEVTYVNEFELPQGLTPLRAFTFLSPAFGADDAAIDGGFTINIPGEQIGVTNVRFGSDGKQASLHVTTKAALRPAQDISAALELAHRASVLSFLASTSDQLHRRWGRKR